MRREKRWVLALVLSLVVAVIGAVAVGCGKAKKYTFNYNSMGGGAVAAAEYTVGDTKFYFPTPAQGDKYGFRFLGWYYDEACSDDKAADAKNIDVSYATDGTITLYAKWTDLYNVSFETSSTDEYFPRAEYHFGDEVKLSELPVPKNMERGGVSAPFKYWKNLAEDTAVTNDFRMPPNDVYLKAVYDTGMSNQFDLDDDGFVSNLGMGKKAFSDVRGALNEETGVYESAELADGKALTFDLTMSFGEYGQDAGAVFAANSYTNGMFDSPMFLYISSTAANAANFGSIQIWGPTVKGEGEDAVVTADKELKMAVIGGSIFKDTPYLAKINACRESGEPTTFTYTVRRCGDTWIIGVDGMEYFLVKTGENAKSGGKIAAVNAGYCGIVTKTDQVHYKNIGLVDADKAEITFDAGEGATITETERKIAWGDTVGTLPVPTREGLTFLGWFYYDGATLKELTETTTFTSDTWRISAFAEWDDPTVQHYNIVFDGGEGGYTHAAIENWYEGKYITLPKPERHLFHTYDGTWYYDAECTQPVDERNISVATATGDGAIKTLTLYGKATYSKFSSGEWSGDENGNITGRGETFVDGYELVVGKTFSVDITLPAYGTTYGNTYLYIGSSDVKVAQYRVIILGTDGTNVKNNTNGAIQLYEYTDGSYKFLGAAFSTRYYLGALKDTSYHTGYNAYKTSAEPFTFTVSVAATADKTYFFVNGNLLYTVNKAVTGKYSGVGVATANTSSFSNLKVEDSKAVITFNADGGILTGDATRTVAACSALGTLPEVTKTGSRFLGWFDGNTAVTAETVIGANVMNKTLVAKWAEQVTVTLNVNGGDALGKTEYVIDKGATLGESLPVPTRAGYTFLGWYNGDTKADDDTTYSESATLTAGWEQKVTVTFDPNEGEVTETTRLIDKGAAIGELPVPTRSEYAFLGWFDGDTQVTTESTFTANVTLIAKWESAPTHTVITVKYADGVTSDETIVLDVGTAIGSQLPTPTRDGYRLNGWKDSGGNDVTAETTFKTSTATITAQWVEVVTVTLDAKGGSGVTATVFTIDKGTAIGSNLPASVTAPLNGDVFIGWFDGDKKVTAETVASANLTLTAHYGWDGATVSESLGGEGTTEKPFLIGSGADLKLLSASYGNEKYTNKVFALTADINLNDKAWTPIGTSGTLFTGTFDGKSHAITGMRVEGTNYLGLFGVIKATVKNLTVVGVVTGEKGIDGILAGQIQGGSTISGVTTKGSVTGGGSDVGGIAGDIKLGTGSVTVSDCVNYATITCTSGGTALAGGITGGTDTLAVTVTIKNCVNYGNVTSNGNFVGGIVGLLRKPNDSLVENCKNFGNITGKTGTGGIVGANRGIVKTSYCYKDALINNKAASTYDLVGITTKKPVTGTISTGSIIGQLDDNNGGTIEKSSCGLCDAEGNAIGV